MMKLQQEILAFMSGKVPTGRDTFQKKKVKRLNYSVVNEPNFYTATIRETDN